jgi:hypothetical protein
MTQEMKNYEVHFIEKSQLEITGKGDNTLWNQATILSDFTSPWDAALPAKMEFKALWDDDNLFFCFTVFDTLIRIDKKDESIQSIGNSDRVELFFRPDNSLNPYYCLEIDTAARIIDFVAYPNKNFDFEWNWPQGQLEVKSSIQDESYTIEGSISISSLKMLNILNDNKIETGIFKAKYNEIEKSIFEPTYISWVDPDSKTPNFHLPSSFGILHLKDRLTI